MASAQPEMSSQGYTRERRLGRVPARWAEFPRERLEDPQHSSSSSSVEAGYPRRNEHQHG
jgi:hypothetical protein